MQVLDNSTPLNNSLVNLSTNFGNLSAVSAYTNSSGIASVLINSTISGTATVNASNGSMYNTTNVTFIAGAPNTISTIYYAEYTVNATSEITVQVYDIYENPVSNFTVLFNATPPHNTQFNSPVEYNSLNLTPKSSLTGPDGQALSLFRTDKRAGDNIISISVQNTSLNTSFMIRGVTDKAENLFLKHTPANVYANNADAYSLIAEIVDKFLNPVLPICCPIKEQIRFTSPSGTTIVPLNIYGTATTLAGPTPYIETVTITATYKNETGYTNLTNTTNLSFIAGDIEGFILYANPDTVLSSYLGGNHNSTISLVALDEWGHTLPDINVTLNNTNTSLGNLTIAGVNSTNLIHTYTDANGKIYALFESKSLSGNATITATCESIIQSTIVQVKSEPFLSVTFSAEPEVLDSGDTVNITTIISVEGELPITRPAASAMLVLDRSGSMDPDYYASTPLDVVMVIDRSGSMNDLGTHPEQPLTDAKAAAVTFMDNLVSNTQVGVVSFASSSSEEIGLTKLNASDNRTIVRDAFNDIIAYGGTAMGEGMAEANEMLNNGRTDARKIMIVLTDGVCNSGSDQGCSLAISDANLYGITVYTIGLGSTDYIDELQLQRVASETGGIYFNAPTSSQLRGIYMAIAQDISDYDITEIEYGEEGFTSYDYQVQGNFTQINTSSPYILSFYIYDIDPDGECEIDINGNYYIDITATGNEKWDYYEYNISHLVMSGTNTITIRDPGDNSNAVKELEITANNIIIARYPTEVHPTSANPYICTFNTSYPYFEDNFLINESINDLKILLNWESSAIDLDLIIKDPNGHLYGAQYDTTGYFPSDPEMMNTSEYIWIYPLSDTYPDTDNETLENGIWTVQVTGFCDSQEPFNITTYIDKKSAAKLASHAFISSFDDSRGDRAGLVLYSSDNILSSNTQTSYLRNGSTWVGYFEGSTPQNTYSLDFTGFDLDTYYKGIGECYITVNNVYCDSMPPPNVANEQEYSYSTDMSDFIVNGLNTISFYDFHDIYGSPWNNEIKDVVISENGNPINSYQNTWVGLSSTPVSYTFNAVINETIFYLTWNNASDNLDLYLYQGTTLINSSKNSGSFEELSAPLYSGYDYHVVVEGVDISSETEWSITVSQGVDWKQWRSQVKSTLINDTIDHLSNSIDTITADGLTAIDEGIYEANNELGIITGNSTMVLMTDGIDNAGYHSMLLEAQRAKDNNTVIYTIGFGNNESEVDPVLAEIADLTGGEYYFAPDAGTLKDIFRGIAANITNFTADGPELNIVIPHNYITDLSLATATYVTNSSNATTGNNINFVAPTYPNRSNAEPAIATEGNETTLHWDLPSLNPGEKWGVWYQLVIQGAGYVPIILPNSNITYTDVNGTNITVNISYGGGSDINGSGADVDYIALSQIYISVDPSVVLIGESSSLTISATYVDDNPAIANILLHSNLGYFNNNDRNPYNMTVSGSGTVNFASARAGQANIHVVGSNANNSVYESVVVIVRPRGIITIS